MEHRAHAPNANDTVVCGSARSCVTILCTRSVCATRHTAQLMVGRAARPSSYRCHLVVRVKDLDNLLQVSGTCIVLGLHRRLLQLDHGPQRLDGNLIHAKQRFDQQSHQCPRKSSVGVGTTPVRGSCSTFTPSPFAVPARNRGAAGSGPGNTVGTGRIAAERLASRRVDALHAMVPDQDQPSPSKCVRVARPVLVGIQLEAVRLGSLLVRRPSRRRGSPPFHYS